MMYTTVQMFEVDHVFKIRIL